MQCSVEEAGAEALAAFVRRSSDLQTFNLNMNDIGTQGISKVSLPPRLAFIDPVYHPASQLS